MVLVAKVFFFQRLRIVRVSTNSALNLSRRLLTVKLVRFVDYIPIDAVGSLELYIDQGGVRINPQRKVALHVSFGPTQSFFCPLAVNPVAFGNGYDDCRQDDPIAFSKPEHCFLLFTSWQEKRKPKAVAISYQRQAVRQAVM
jgi:hypothetical protein